MKNASLSSPLEQNRCLLRKLKIKEKWLDRGHFNSKNSIPSIFIIKLTSIIIAQSCDQVQPQRSSDATLYWYFSSNTHASTHWGLCQYHYLLSWVCLWDVNRGLCRKGTHWGLIHSPHMTKPSIKKSLACLLADYIQDLNIWDTILDGKSQDAPKAVVLEHVKTVQLAGCPCFTTVEQSWKLEWQLLWNSHLGMQANHPLLFPPRT